MGSAATADVAIIAQLPTGLTGVVVSNGGSYDPTTGIVTWPLLPAMAPGETAVYTVTLPPQPAGATVLVSANVTTPTTETTTANNTSTAQVVVPAVIPTLSFWAMAILSLGLLMLVRRQPRMTE
ncbi:MAG: hypothetical protein U1F68_11555 [Gammaproteobacteria bacterium]